MNMITEWINMLAGDHGLLAQVSGWIGTLRVALKPVNEWIKAKMSYALVRVASTPDTDDDAAMLKVLNSKPWRVTAFWLDILLSIKIPLAADFDRVLIEEAKRKGEE